MYDYMKSNPEEGTYRGAFDESRRKLRALDPVVIEKTPAALMTKNRGFSLVCFGQPLMIPYPDGDVFLQARPKSLRSAGGSSRSIIFPALWSFLFRVDGFPIRISPEALFFTRTSGKMSLNPWVFSMTAVILKY